MIGHLEDLHGAPIWNFAPGATRPADHAVRLSVEWKDYDKGQTMLDLFPQFLEHGDTHNLPGLIIGPWDYESSETSAPIVEALVAARDHLQGLRALFIGDITSEENEISWIQQSDLSPLLNAFPDLEFLGARGGDGLFFGSPQHPKLKALVAESGGLDGRLVRSLMSAQLPALEHLELYLGTDDYGGTTTQADLEPLLQGEVFPALKYLGLRDYNQIDVLAPFIANAPILSRIETLDLSLGTLTDAGAQALLDSSLVPHLKTLDLHHHFCSDEMIARLEALPLLVDASDQQKADVYDGEAYRYCAVTE